MPELELADVPLRRHGPDRRAGAAALVAALACLSGCYGNSNAAFPEEVGYAPLETQASSPTLAWPAWPAGTDAEPYPEGPGTPTMASGEFFDAGGSGAPPGISQLVLTDHHYYAHERAYIRRPLAEVWVAMQDPEVGGYDPTKIDTKEAIPIPDGKWPVHYKYHYTASKFGISVWWENEWRGGVDQGTMTAPLQVGLRSQKIDGTNAITVQAFSVVATPVPGRPDVTQLEVVGWLWAAADNNTATIEQTCRYWYETLFKRVYGL